MRWLALLLLVGCTPATEQASDEYTEAVYFHAWALHEHTEPEASVLTELSTPTPAADDGVTDAAGVGHAQDSPSEINNFDESKGGADLPVADVHTETQFAVSPELEIEQTEQEQGQSDAQSPPQSEATEGELAKPLLLMISSPNCVPCQRAKPILEKLRDDFDVQVIELNSIPYFQSEGRELEGWPGEEQFLNWLENEQ